jgi:radical SAM superfamily enzyme YgiQ (UPF0313 family)
LAPGKHPKGVRARILLTSVFGPYARDDEFGSRAINPMELYHNQVTRVQGAFSLRMHHRSWGIMMIQANIAAPTTVLDFPTREIFQRELQEQRYDIVGISSIIVNVGKVREMCRMVRRLSPGAVIVVGGHVAAIPGLDTILDADHIVRGDGISWMRRYLGEDETAPIRHPHLLSSFGMRAMGIRAPVSCHSTAATVIPSVGCPLGCNFCTTSAFFGGKGKFLNFYENGDELFRLMDEMESAMKVRSFFIMDENFLLHRQRALQLLERMKEKAKSWALYVFSSANALRKYSAAELVELGISWVWMGLESPRAAYAKLQGIDTLQLARELRRHGIKVLGSTIVGLEHHTPDNIAAEIEHAVAHQTDFHQFMLYTPVPGTPLYRDMAARGLLLEDVDPADIHGQYQFNFRHPAISREDSKKFLDWAFWCDFERNGPSLFRICRTTLEGWKRYKNHPEARVRTRFEWEVENLKKSYNASLWAMEQLLRKTNAAVSEQIHRLRREIEEEFGLPARLAARLFGPVLWWTSRREEKRLIRGHTYEPRTFIERANWAAG